MVVVTGAAGHLGNVLVRTLVERGFAVRALVLPGEQTESLAGLPVEVVRGDVRDAESLPAIFSGCDLVFHVAGLIAIAPGRESLLWAVNVGGTRNVIDACRSAHVRRLIYTSSVHAFALVPEGQPTTEGTEISPERAAGAYGKSKAQATVAVLAAADERLETVVLCPAGIIGPFDYGRSRTGRFLSFLARSALVGLPEGGYDFVDVRDVAEAEVRAAERGVSGQVYIVSGERARLEELSVYARSAVGRSARSVRLPLWLCRFAARITEAIRARSGNEPLLTAESLEIIRSNSLISSAKAEREIAYRHRPLLETVRDTIAWHLRRSSGPILG